MHKIVLTSTRDNPIIKHRKMIMKVIIRQTGIHLLAGLRLQSFLWAASPPGT